jgi:hypothetical protein
LSEFQILISACFLEEKEELISEAPRYLMQGKSKEVTLTKTKQKKLRGL